METAHFLLSVFISSLKGRLKCLEGRVIALEHKSEQATGC